MYRKPRSPHNRAIRGTWKFVFTLVVLGALPPAAVGPATLFERFSADTARAEAEARPPFARRYVGTVAGSFTDGEGRTDSWRVTGLAYRLSLVQFGRGLWSGYYTLRSARVTFRSTAADGEGCSYSVERTFTVPRGSLRLGPNRITFAQEPRNRVFVYVGVANADLRVPVSWTCPDPDDSRSDDIATGSWWNTGVGKRFRPGRALQGTSTLRSEAEIYRWSWNLRPAR